MRSLALLAFGIVCTLGLGAVVLAQDPTPAATPSGADCASPSPNIQIGQTTTPIVITASPAASPPTCREIRLTIDAVELAFRPAEVSIPADTPVLLTIHNAGVALHNFSIDSLDISVLLIPGESKTVTINAPAGTFEFYCDVPGHKQAGMVGTLLVSQ